MNPESEHTRVQTAIASINGQTKVAITLAIGGMLVGLVGAVLFVLGIQADAPLRTTIAGYEVSAADIGVASLATSSFWALLAYFARPRYPE
ncbi:MAG: hypothetical protein ACT4N4_00750 [Rhodospirillales bacterium]